MGKINEKINSLIMEATKEKNKDKSNAYKNLKAKFLEYQTAKNAKPLDDAAEIAIMKKMAKELTEDAKTFATHGRIDLANEYTRQSSYIQVFLPNEATREDVENALKEITSGTMQVEKQDMGITIKAIKSRFESVDGKLVADVVKEHLV